MWKEGVFGRALASASAAASPRALPNGNAGNGSAHGAHAEPILYRRDEPLRACLIWAKLCARARQLQGAVFDFVYLFPGLSLWMQKNVLSLGSGRTLLMSVFLEPCSFRRLCSSSVTSPRSPPSSPRSTAESEPVASSLMPPPAGERRRRPWVARRRPGSGGAAARSPCALVGALGSARGRQKR